MINIGELLEWRLLPIHTLRLYPINPKGLSPMYVTADDQTRSQSDHDGSKNIILFFRVRIERVFMLNKAVHTFVFGILSKV
jgi:hypothetical protein